MGSIKSSILVYGSPANPVISYLLQYLSSRSSKPVVFIQQETFLTQTKLTFSINQNQIEGSFILPDGSGLNFSEISGLCMENQFVSAYGFTELSEKDKQYVQTEGWAALLAAAASLSHQCAVLNPLPKIDLSMGRGGAVLLLKKYGFDSPHFLITSDPEKAKEFYQTWKGQVIYKHVKDPDTMFKKMTNQDLQRIEKISYCPVHFEEYSPGKVIRLVTVEKETFGFEESLSQTGAVNLSLYSLEENWKFQSLQLAQDINIPLLEIRLRITPDGKCQGLGVYPFASLPILTFTNEKGDSLIGRSILNLLEQGNPLS